jgi:hypothetical protein
MDQHIIFVGLDVHKDTTAVALAEASKRGEVREGIAQRPMRSRISRKSERRRGDRGILVWP